MSSEQVWEKYEDVARQLLLDVRELLGLNTIEPKQKIQGKSGSEWEIDIVAYDSSTGKLVLVECKNWKKRPSQETVAKLAYSIQDTNADRGIIVTKMGLQKGAKIVANYEKITEIKLDINVLKNNYEDYIAVIKDRIFFKLTDVMPSVSFTSISGVTTVELPFYQEQIQDK